MSVRFGIDRWLTNPPPKLTRARLGMVTSNVATAAFNGETSRVALRRAGFNLVRLFGPEHGLRATAADGAHVADEIDPATNLPVVSLYGDRVRPKPETLQDLDALIYDIPDVGARFYTYIWTLSHLMEACAQANKPLYVLDRPNPIAGNLAATEGPILDEQSLSSFVGRWNIPIRYSLTIGELAQLWNVEKSIRCELHIIPCQGWQRNMHWPDTRLEWIKLSPAMPSYETALLYPGACLFEGTNLSEGRGTDAPFRNLGAPWVDGPDLATQFNALNLPGIQARATTFTPQGRKYAGELCRGIRLEISDSQTFRPVAAGLHLLSIVIRLHPQHFAWLPEHFDRLIGQPRIRQSLHARTAAIAINDWASANAWSQRAKPYLLYE